MHTLQSEMVKSLDTDISDQQLLDVINEAWNFVQRENEKQFHLVSENDQKMWLLTDQSVQAKLTRIQQDTSVHGELSSAHRQELRSIGQMIIQAYHQNMSPSLGQKLRTLISQLFQMKGHKNGN